MRPAGRLVTIKRSGADGAHFPLSLSSCLFGRGTECDIRIQLPVVSKQHCKIEIKEQKAILCNFSSTNPTQVNGSAIQEPVPLKHGDIITIIDRSFRYENESCQNGSKSTESPARTCEQRQDPARRASRAGSSADPDGKEQDSKAHSKVMEKNAWGKLLEHAEKLTGDSSVLDGADPEPPSTWSSEHQGHDGRNAGDSSSGDLKSRVTLVSRHGTPRSAPSAQCFDNSKRNESPFKKLYQSMKEELHAKSPGQNVQCRRKSGSHSDSTEERESTGGLQREPPLILSCQSKRKSGRSTPMKEDPFPEPETSRTEKGSDTEPAEASKRLVGSSTPLSKMTRENATVRCPRQPSAAQEHEDEDLCVTLGERAGVKALDATVTPGKLLTKNQVPIRAEGTANPSKMPENLSSRNRRSAPTNMEVLPPEIQSQPILAQYRTPVERKIQKDSFNKPEKLGTAAGQICSGLPGLSSVDIINFGDSIKKSEDLSLKRRRVSFGIRLRPELFDENLPPNTPLKRGETPAKRKSLTTHSPAVLKKIIKEQPASLGTESPAVCWEVKAQSVSTGSPAAGPRVTAPGPGDQRRMSGKASADSGGKSPQDTPKKAGRKSGHLSSKRTSISRSQHGILQMICSKRRSGASEANLIVAKSWADVVKLGAKQAQTKVVKHGPQRQMNRRQRRPNTPKKPTSPVHHQFSTGHANSPCTIIIGKAQIEKVTVPARPYRMLNNLAFNQKIDYKEDLSGLTEMFKTPVKEMTQRTATSPSTLSSSEKSLGKKSQATDSGGKPLPLTLEISESKVFSSTQKTAKEPSDKCFASPSLRRQSIRKDENTVRTPKNISKMTHFEIRTPHFSPEPLKIVSSASKLRRSMGLRNAEEPQVESKTEAEADAAGALSGRRPRETPREGQTGCREASKKPEESTKSEAKCGRSANTRRSRTGGPKCEPTASLTDLEKTLEVEPQKDLSGSQRLPQTPGRIEDTVNEEEEATDLPCRTPPPDPANPTARGQRQHKRAPGKVGAQEEAPALRKSAYLPREATHTHAALGEGRSIGVLLKGTPEQNNDPVVDGTGTKSGPRTPKKKAQLLENLAGFKEIFQIPKHIEESIADDKTQLLGKSPQPGPVGTPTSTKKRINTLQGKADVKEECPALERLRETPREARHTGRAPGGDGRAVRALEEPAEQALCPAASVAGGRWQEGPSRKKAQPLEDLAGFQELFQTPARGEDPKTAGETTDTPHKSTGPEPRGTLTPSKRQPRTSLQRVEEEEELSPVIKLQLILGEIAHTEAESAGNDEGVKMLKRPAKRKLDAENITGNKRRRVAPEGEAQPLEDLAGFQELFQTPTHDKDPKTAGESTDAPCKSTGLEPGRAAASTRRQSQTSVGKVEVKEELSALRRLSQSPGRATHTPTGPVHKKGTRALMGTPLQKVNPAEDLSGLKRQPRTPKEQAQPLEDLADFQELFQTPGHDKDLKTAGESTDTPCKSTGLEPGRAAASTRRRSKTSVGKVEVKEELSALRRLSQSSGRATHTPTGPIQEEKGTRALIGTPQQKVNPAQDLTGLKRQPRTPKEQAQPLEDLVGFQELFQTPARGEDPKTAGETTDTPCKSTGPEPRGTLTPSKRRPRPSLQRVEEEEELSALRRLSQSPGRATHTPTRPIQEEKDTRALMGTPKQKLDLNDNSTGQKRQPRTPKEQAQPLEDLAGFRELFQTPAHEKDPKTAGESTDTPCKSTGLEPGRAAASTRRRSKTSVGKVEVKEELSALRRLSQSPGRATGPVEEEKGIRALGTPRQKLDLNDNSTGQKRQPRTPKEKTQPLEDLAGFQELFQTPGHDKDLKTAGEATDTPCKSTGLEPGRIAASTRRRSKTSVGKVEVKEETSVLREVTQMSREATHTPRVPRGDDEAIRAFEESAQQALHAAAKVTGSKWQPGAPREKSQPLEDLAGFQELFQTPVHDKDRKTAGESTDTPCKSTGLEPGRASASTRRRSKTSMGKVEVKEELSALRRLSQSSGRALHTPTGPVQEKGTRALIGTPQQKVNPAEDLTGLKRQPRTPKEQAQPLEDLVGFQELFQTPAHEKDLKTAGESTDAPCKSTGLEPGRIAASTRRRSKTSVGKVEVKEELSALRRLSQSPGRATGPVEEEKGIRALGTPRQKLDLNDNSTGQKRQPRTPKEKTQPLEDLAGFQELFQTPARGEDPKTAGETTDTPCKSTGPEPRGTLTPSKRQPRTSLQRVEEEEELSPVIKLQLILGEIAHTEAESAGDDEGVKMLKRPAKRKLDAAENVTGNKRRRVAPEGEAQPLEDLAGSKEPVPAPGPTEAPTSDEKTTETPCRSPQPEPGDTLASTRRRPRTRLRTAEVKEEPPAVRKPKRTSRATTHTHTAAGGEDEGSRTSEGSAQWAPAPAARATGSRRLRWAPEVQAPALEDLAGSREPVQAPGPTEGSAGEGRTTKIPCKSPQAEQEETPAPLKRPLRTRLRKAAATGELPVQGGTSGGPVHSHQEPKGDSENIKVLKEPVKQKLGLAAGAAGSRRRRGAPEGEAQPLEDLAGSKEPIAAPGPTEATSVEKTTEMPCGSPQPEPGDTPASTRRRPRTRLRTAEVKEEPPAVRKPKRTSRATTHTHTAAGGEDEGSRASEGSAQQAPAPAARATGSRRLRWAPEVQAPALEDLAGSREPVQAPGPTEGSAGEGRTTKIPCKSPQAEQEETPAPLKRPLRTRLRKAAATGELPVQGEVAGTSGGPVHSYQEPKGDSENIKVLKEPVKRKLGLAAGVAGSRRRRGAPEGEAQPLEDLAGSKEPIPAPGPTEATSDEKTTEMPCGSPQPEPGDTPASTRRRPRTRLRTAEVKEEPPAVRKPKRTSRATTHTHTAAGGEDEGSRASEGSAQQAPAPAARATGSRWLRGAPEVQAPALEDLAGSREPMQAPGPTERPRHDAQSLKSTPKQTAERAKPLSPCRRARRAPKEKPVEDGVGRRHRAASQSSISLPRGGPGSDGLLSGVGALCSETVPQDTVQAKAVQGRRRAAPRDRGRSPEPLAMNKVLKLLINRIEPVEEHSPNSEATKKEHKVEDSAAADKGMSRQTKHQNKAEREEQRPEIIISAEKIKRQEKKPTKISQEVKPQNPGDGDEKPASGGKVREKRVCSRSGRRNQVSQPHTTEEEVREKSTAVSMRNQEEKGATTNSDLRCLRSRKPGLQPRLESEPEQRVTRGAKRCTENLMKDKDTVYTKKIRSRSRRDIEDI